MRRWFVLMVVWLLPLQFAWSAASAYCQHETSAPQMQHLGHHAHAHPGEAKQPGDSRLLADADCTACHAGTAAAMPALPDGHDFAGSSQAAEPVTAPPFTSALARAPDRPQWLRLV